MKKYPLLYTSLVLVILLGVLHFIAETFYLYWTLWWFDNVAHFLGGLALGYVSLYIFCGSGIFKGKISLAQTMLASFVLVMILGSIWEIFEYANGITESTEKYSLDIIHDLLSDALGVIFALWTAKRFLKSS